MVRMEEQREMERLARIEHDRRVRQEHIRMKATEDQLRRRREHLTAREAELKRQEDELQTREALLRHAEERQREAPRGQSVNSAPAPEKKDPEERASHSQRKRKYPRNTQ